MIRFYQQIDRFVRRASTKGPRKRTRKVITPSRDARLAFLRARSAASLASWQSKLSAVALALVVVMTLAAFYNADTFYIYDFEASGLQQLSKTDLERSADFVGFNVFFLDPKTIEHALGQVPEIRSTKVMVGFPNRLRIEVQEREPWVTWVTGSESYWVDAGGVGFRARFNRSDLPTVRDLDQAPVRAGERVHPSGIAAVRALFTAWPSAPRQTEWSNSKGLAIVESHGWKVYLGNADEMDGKITKLRVLTGLLLSQNAKIKFIDLGKGDPFYQ